MKLSSKILQIVKSFTPKFSKDLGVYEYPQDIHPDVINYLSRHSISTHTATNLMTQYVVGKGIPSINNVKVRGDNTAYELTIDIAKSIVVNRGFYVHRNLTMNGNTTSLKVLPFEQMRVGKKDDKNYNGKILQKIDWSDSKEKPIVYDVWNDDKNVIEAQFKKQGDDYKGQVLFVNLDAQYIYPYPRLTPVINDAYSEIQASQYKKNSLDSGFFGKYWIITPPLVESLIDVNQNDKEAMAEYQQSISDRKALHNNVQGLLGVDNVGNVLMSEMKFESPDDIDKQLVVKEFKTNIDDKLFAFTESSVKNNILMAFNNLPVMLATTVDTGLLGNSGEMLKTMKLHYQESTERERELLEQNLSKIFRNFEKIKLDEFKITPLIEVVEKVSGESTAQTSESTDENAKAQAQLRGSVGGVQGILQIQQSFSEGLTSLTSALTILQEIYGFNEEVARDLLGNPDKIDE